MNYPNQPPFVIPQLSTQCPPPNMDPARLTMTQFSRYPPPSVGNMQQFQPHVIPQVVHPNYYGPERGVSLFYSPGVTTFYPDFSNPPPSHQGPYGRPQPFVPQISYEALAEQIKQAPTGPPPSIPQNMPHQSFPQMPQMHLPNQQVPYPRQHHGHNSLSRGQTPTTASHQSSPQNSQSTETKNSANAINDYSPAGMPRNITPMTDDQVPHLIPIEQSSDKGIEILANKFSETKLSDRNHPEHQIKETDVYNPNKPIEVFNSNYQNHDNKNWQMNVRGNDRNSGYNYDTYNSGRNDRRSHNQQPSRQQRYQSSRSSQDGRPMQNQQRFQQPQVQNQQRPRQLSNQWRNPANESVQQGPEKVKVIECTYCRMLGKSVEEYSSHIIREPSGESNCPEIQKQTCSSCNASNNMAHDEYFCPKNQKNDNNNLPKIAENLQKFLEHKKNPPQSNHYQHQNFSHGGYRRH